MENLTLTGFGTITAIGSALNNVLAATTRFDRQRNTWIASHLDGAAGNDILIGGEGNDTLTGGSGNDRYRAGAGDPAHEGGGSTAGAGTDVLELRATSLGLSTALAAAFDSFGGDLKFSRVNAGQDLRIDLAVDGGASAGAITVVGMNNVAAMVESLRLYGGNGVQIGGDTDLTSVWAASTTTARALRSLGAAGPLARWPRHGRRAAAG